MRQLLNVCYAAIVEWKDDDERKQFDIELNRDPRRPVSYGSLELIAMMKRPGIQG